MKRCILSITFVILLILTGAAYASDAFSPRATLIDTPNRLTSAFAYSILVGGIGVVAYRYRLDNGAWSDETDVNNPMEFELLTEGFHALSVIGMNAAGFWQSENDTTHINWILDFTPPEAWLSNYPMGTVSATDIAVRVGGSDVIFYRYSLDGYAWSNIYSVSIPVMLSGLSEGPHTLTVIGADMANNWQERYTATQIYWEIDFFVPTAVLANIPESITRETSAEIQVTASVEGPDIEAYVYTLDDGVTWSNGYVGVPIELRDMGEGNYTLCVNIFGAGIWQVDSTCVQWRVDLTPAESATLAVTTGVSDSSSANLSWTWDSDDPQKTLQRYRVWYSKNTFDSSSPYTATQAFCDLTPGSQGYEEEFILDGLLPNQQYYFAVDTIDVVGNISDLSNVVSIITADSLPEIDTISLTVGGVTTDNSADREIAITGSNFLEYSRNNIIRFENSDQVFDFYNKTKTGSSIGQIFADIPTGAPTGIYQVRVINKNGISLASSDSITIIEAAIPYPTVRAASPMVVQPGVSTPITIEGGNFDTPPAGVNLLSKQGGPTPLTSVSGINDSTLTANIDVSGDFQEGSYNIQVINEDSRANDVSASVVEIYHPVILNYAHGPVTTTRIIKKLINLPDGMTSVRTILSTDDRDEAGRVDKDDLKVKVHIKPGSMFELYDPEGDQWNDYSGSIQPPRQVPAIDHVIQSMNMHSIQFNMGNNNPLRLKNSETMFMLVDATFPSDVSDIAVYSIRPDTTLTPAGVDGTFRNVEISQGGSVLSSQSDNPEEGKTTHTIGVLLTHMSQYAIGELLDSDDDGVPDYLDFEPIAIITSPDSNKSITVGESINFQSSVTSGNEPYTYLWDFGGGAINSTEKNPGNVTFQTIGVYIVTLTGTDADGDSDSNNVTITVNDQSDDDNDSDGGGGGGGGGCFVESLKY